MCKAVEEYAKERENKAKIEGLREGKIEGKIETVRNMIEKGLDLNTALGYVDIDRTTYDKYKNGLQ